MANCLRCESETIEKEDLLRHLVPQLSKPHSLKLDSTIYSGIGSKNEHFNNHIQLNHINLTKDYSLASIDVCVHLMALYIAICGKC